MRYDGKLAQCSRGECSSNIRTVHINSAVPVANLSAHFRSQNNCVIRKEKDRCLPAYQRLSLSEQYLFNMSSLLKSIKNLAIGGNTNTLNGIQESSIYLGWFYFTSGFE